MLKPRKIECSHWRERAENARAVAQQMRNPETKAAMLRIADEYDEAAAKFDIDDEGESEI